jgi:hypothetical protein
MLQQWSPMDVEDALELLSSNFTHPAVRRYAVSRLRQAPDEVVCLCNFLHLHLYKDKVHIFYNIIDHTTVFKFEVNVLLIIWFFSF